MNIKIEKVKLTSGGSQMEAFVAFPDGGGAHPAVIVIEEIFGVNAHIRDVTERVAREGYVAIAPDVHHRAAPAGFEYPYNQEGMQKGMQLIQKLTAHGFDEDVNATLAYLKSRKDVKSDRLGVMGFCIGGHLAFLAAATHPFAAAASFYGGGIASFSPGGGAPTVEKAGNIKGRILCFFGDKDPMIPKEHVDKIKHALEQHHVKHEVHVYPGASHAFFCDVKERGSYVPAAAEDAWKRTKQLFHDVLQK